MTRARKRDVDKAALRGIWEKQAAGLGFDARALVPEAMARGKDAGREGNIEVSEAVPGPGAGPGRSGLGHRPSLRARGRVPAH